MKEEKEGEEEGEEEREEDDDGGGPRRGVGTKEGGQDEMSRGPRGSHLSAFLLPFDVSSRHPSLLPAP